jgi:hypothetical protein
MLTTRPPKPLANTRSEGEVYKYGESDMTRGSMAAIPSYAAKFKLVLYMTFIFIKRQRPFQYLLCRKPILSLEKALVLLAGLHPSRKIFKHATK